MPCYHPLPAWFASHRNPSGKRSLVFRPVAGVHERRQVEVPCGRCIGCRLERSRQWAIRGVHEASQHACNSFVTLTYAPEHVPAGGSLVLRDLQLFVKRLRKSVEHRLRFLACGEYGEQLSRPHYHLILFGHSFPDARFWRIGPGGFKQFRSDALERLWPFGFSSVGEVTFESIAYVARYVTKKVNGPLADAHYGGRKPEFLVMSRRPGIGAGFYARFARDLYPSDRVVLRGRGVFRPPKFYDRLLEVDAPSVLATLKLDRVERSRENPDNTGTRLVAREFNKEAQAVRLQRSYES